MSHLTRGAWIEMSCLFVRYCLVHGSHLTRGAWIEMYVTNSLYAFGQRRTSHEVRGLKYTKSCIVVCRLVSHLTRGAWIEISKVSPSGNADVKSHLTRGAWIEISKTLSLFRVLHLSHLTRGAWIEILRKSCIYYTQYCRTSHEVRGLK